MFLYNTNKLYCLKHLPFRAESSALFSWNPSQNSLQWCFKMIFLILAGRKWNCFYLRVLRLPKVSVALLEKCSFRWHETHLEERYPSKIYTKLYLNWCHTVDQDCSIQTKCIIQGQVWGICSVVRACMVDLPWSNSCGGSPMSTSDRGTFSLSYLFVVWLLWLSYGLCYPPSCKGVCCTVEYPAPLQTLHEILLCPVSSTHLWMFML